MHFKLALLSLLLAGCATTQSAVHATSGLHAETYGPKRGSSVQTLIVVLHGKGTPDHYRFASAAARAIPDAAAVALTEVRDDRAPKHLAAVGDAVTALRARYPQARTIVVGNADGAAIAANLAGIRPALVDGMVLVGCPCTRLEMEQQTSGEHSGRENLDPLQTAGGILPSIRVAVLVGANDKITPANFSRAYAEALALRGIATDYRILPARGHDLLDDPEVLAATERLAAAMPKKG